TLQFRGREMAHPELGSKILDEVLEAAGPLARVDNQARLEGRSMSMVLSPDKKAAEAAKKAEAAAAAAEGPTNVNEIPGGENAENEDQ
ncbi:MAG: translation initiation factor IF-3 C-terminal domain-containing protein, partial [Actinomycetota bacterium]|nr:translation initiation factor IF-3 C-terminal domain-containing protein [Actinomycetota bacterium]